MIRYWIDRVAGVAYISVRSRLEQFAELLAALDRLLNHPAWQPGTPIVEDLRELHGPPPAHCVEQWRAYVVARSAVLSGCRWAVVRRPDALDLADVLETAAHVSPSGVTLQQFSNMIDAHAWVRPVGEGHAAGAPSPPAPPGGMGV